MAKKEPKQEVLPGVADVEGAIRHLYMAITNLTSAVERGGQDVSHILKSVRTDAGAAIECLAPRTLEQGDVPGGVERTAAQIAAADAANQSDPENVS